jgi:hypothetical protein
MYRICRHAEVFSPQITTNRKVPHLQRLRNLTIILVRKFSDLRFAELICGLYFSVLTSLVLTGL